MMSQDMIGDSLINIFYNSHFISKWDKIQILWFENPFLKQMPYQIVQIFCETLSTRSIIFYEIKWTCSFDSREQLTLMDAVWTSLLSYIDGSMFGCCRLTSSWTGLTSSSSLKEKPARRVWRHWWYWLMGWFCH